MQLLISQRNGADIIKESLGKFTDWEWEFVASGEASESPFHQWDCAFYVGRNPDRTVYALEIADLGDLAGPDDRPYKEIVALLLDPMSGDEGWIVRHLLQEYCNAGGKYIESFHQVGRFKLDEDAER